MPSRRICDIGIFILKTFVGYEAAGVTGRAKLLYGRMVKVSDINLFCSLLILDVRSLLRPRCPLSLVSGLPRLKLRIFGK